MSPRRQQPEQRPEPEGRAVPLLNELLNNTLDRGYAEAARQRAARSERGEPEPGRLPATLVVAVGLMLVGLLLGVAYRQTRQQAPEAARVKLALIHDIEAKTRTSDDLERRAEYLTGQVAAERDSGLATSSEGSAVRRRLAGLESCDGLVPVRGPGMVVTLGDAAPQQQINPVTGGQAEQLPDEKGRISDHDLQSVVNVIWASGAEAVAIDGRRLAPTSTIRGAGGAILVDFFPVTTPYRIEVIGDPRRLLPRFVDSPVAQQFQTYVGAYRIQFDVQHADGLSLPAATGIELRYAGPLAMPGPSAGAGRTGSSGPAGSSGTAGPGPTGSAVPASRPPGTPTPGGGP
jgi:uncharacterized protein YlxW (UPF0749 family)